MRGSGGCSNQVAGGAKMKKVNLEEIFYIFIISSPLIFYIVYCVMAAYAISHIY